MSTTAERFTVLHQKIAYAAARSGRPTASIRLVAVAKTASEEQLQAAWAWGQRVFGHNRVQALEAHRQVLPQAEWHLLGPLQGRKVRRAMAAAQLLQALGDEKTLQRCVSVLAETPNLVFPVLLQVNLHPEDGRYGCALPQLPALVDSVLAAPSLHLAGLMFLAQAEAEEARLRRDFAQMRQQFEQLQQSQSLAADAILSMGMSQDFEIAIEEGANLVRVGRALFPPSEF